MKQIVLLTAICSFLTSCSNTDEAANSIKEFVQYISERPIGAGADEWLELQNIAGEWEKTVLVFGYATGDGAAEECQKIAKALKNANHERDYRCVPANFERIS